MENKLLIEGKIESHQKRLDQLYNVSQKHTLLLFLSGALTLMQGIKLSKQPSYTNALLFGALTTLSFYEGHQVLVDSRNKTKVENDLKRQKIQLKKLTKQYSEMDAKKYEY